MIHYDKYTKMTHSLYSANQWNRIEWNIILNIYLSSVFMRCQMKSIFSLCSNINYILYEY